MHFMDNAAQLRHTLSVHISKAPSGATPISTCVPGIESASGPSPT